MNWLAFGLAWLAGMIFYFAGYYFGLKVGHMRGHRCEAMMQRIYNAIDIETIDKDELK